MNTNEYFKEIETRVRACYDVAEEARKKGFDPQSKVEIALAMSLAEKAIGLIATVYPQLDDRRIIDRILELEKEYGPLDMAVPFKIAEEIAKEKFCKFESLLQAIDAGIRVGFAYITLGVVSSPIEGFTEVKLKKTANGKEFFAAYFSGPIRSAGTTASCMVLFLIDYLRELFGFARYDPTDKEVKRYVTENYDYHEKVNNLQYLPTEEEITFLAKNLPIQIAGEPTEQKEVSNYKDLDRIETNCIRGGMCLCFSEGLAQKAQKGLRLLRGLQAKGFKITGWEFLEDYIILHKKREKGTTSSYPTYIKDLVAGRPVFGHPSASGGFRFRYGRSRVNGFSAVSVHPATMGISDCFLSSGNQLKIEKPTKGCIITSCDTIDGPIVKLKSGSVKKIDDFEEAKKIYPDVEEILYLGDILFPVGDVINRNYELLKPGYVEEWWNLELEKASGKLDTEKLDFSVCQELKENANSLHEEISLEKAIEFSRTLSIPLHPKYIFYWSQIDFAGFLALLDWISHGSIAKKIILPYNKTSRERFSNGKRALELIGLTHDVTVENVVLAEETSKALLVNLGIEKNWENLNLEKEIDKISRKIKECQNVLEAINLVAKYKVKDKAGCFIGTRMGRPEKAKMRRLTGSPNVLFPVGEEGGRMRSVNEALEQGSIKADFPLYYCKKCEKETIYFKCENCNEDCERLNYCPECHQKFKQEKCPQHAKGQSFMPRRIETKHYFDLAVKKINLLPNEIPKLIKGVRGTSNEFHDIENLAKGVLRAKYHITVNKDGTVRYDATEVPVTHFKPREVMASVEKLRELGYNRDIHGVILENENQILELKPHDVILSACPESPDERADDVFFNIANFLDELLVKLYNLKPFYNINTKEDLIGHLVVCMAPHNCAGVVGRIVGFSKVQGLMASPYMHAAMRRDCVAPETKIFFYDKNSNDIFYDSIGDYVEKLLKENVKFKEIDSFGTLAIENKKNLFALGIDPVSHNLIEKKIKYFIKGPETKQWIKITTATNREYTMTPTHKFMHIENGEFKFKNAQEIKIDDKIPVLENFNFQFETEAIDLIKLFKEKLQEEEQKEILVVNQNKEQELLDFSGKTSENLMLRHKFSKHLITAKLKITPELLRILGYYAAEGYSRQSKSVSQVAFRICNSDMQEYIIKLIKDIFNIRANLGEGNSKITICSKLVYYIFKCLGAGKSAYEKRVPGFIFGLNQKLVKEYISAYFEGDGSVIKGTGRIAFYSVSRSLLDDMALLLAKFKIFSRYFRTGLRIPGKKVLERYKELKKDPKMHILNHLVLGKCDSFKLGGILKIINKKKSGDLTYLKPCSLRYINYNKKQILLESQSDYVVDYIKKIEILKEKKNSYCLEVDWKEPEERNVLWGEQVINTRCDGDEAAVMMLMDVLLNFSRKFLPSHRGGTQDAPLVLNARIRAGEVDDQILDFEVEKYPLELYELAEQGKHSSELKIKRVKERLKLGEDCFSKLEFTHDTNDFNAGVVNSSYKSLPSMQEKVARQMLLAEKLRAVKTEDVARLVIERHFIRDIRGNLRKFSQQEFRCSKCNEKYRRPPLTGGCKKCSGNIIFTVSEGSIIKYVEPALSLARNYNVSAYVKQSLELTKSYIESIFGKEKEKQEALGKWFG
ncbi:MAG: DNA polymerase II large subunit [Candidatus Pacearchaeota archaeon]|nr:DNA polymerase II large subunit [Candidatus Pacearchaeota archaeon]